MKSICGRQGRAGPIGEGLLVEADEEVVGADAEKDGAVRSLQQQLNDCPHVLLDAVVYIRALASSGRPVPGHSSSLMALDPT